MDYHAKVSVRYGGNFEIYLDTSSDLWQGILDVKSRNWFGADRDYLVIIHKTSDVVVKSTSTTCGLSYTANINSNTAVNSACKAAEYLVGCQEYTLTVFCYLSLSAGATWSGYIMGQKISG